jgi:hypothetical protein
MRLAATGELTGHANQVVELFLSGRPAALRVTERAQAEGAERLVQQAQRNIDDGSVAQRLDQRLVGSGIGAGVFDHDRFIAADDLFHQHVALDLQHWRNFPSQITLTAGEVDQPHLAHVLVVGNEQPNVWVPGSRNRFLSRDLEELLKRAGALQLSRKR